MYLNNFNWSKTTNLIKKIKIKKREREIKALKFNIFIVGVISNIRLILGRLSGGIVFNINIFRARLEERTCSTKVELNGAKVNFKEVFHSIHAKVFKASGVVGVQQISELFGSSKLHYRVFFGLIKKGTQLIIPFFKVVETSVLLNNVNSELFDEVLQFLGLVFSLGCHLSPALAVILDLLDPRLKQDPHLVHLRGLPGHSDQL